LDSVDYLDIQSPAGAALKFNFAGGTTDDVVAISAPNMGNLVLQGTLGGGQDKVMIKVADIPVSAGQVRELSVDTSGLTGVGHLTFDFADVADTVVLTNSNFSNIATIEVKKGEADLHQVSIPDGIVFIVNSGLTLTVAQLLATESISSVTGLGRLTIIADTADQLRSVVTQIAAKIASNPAFLIGFAAAEPGYIEVKVGTTVVASNQTGVTVSSPDADGVALMNALAGGSLPSIPTLARLVDDLEAQITDLEVSGREHRHSGEQSEHVEYGSCCTANCRCGAGRPTGCGRGQAGWYHRHGGGLRCGADFDFGQRPASANHVKRR
jgi:hypothetical protein